MLSTVDLNAIKESLEGLTYDTLKSKKKEEQLYVLNLLANTYKLNMVQSAEILGVHKTTFYSYVRRLDYSFPTSRNNSDGIAPSKEGDKGAETYKVVNDVKELFTDTKADADALIEEEKKRLSLYANTQGINIMEVGIYTGEELAEQLELLAKLVRKKEYLFNYSIQIDPLVRAN